MEIDSPNASGVISGFGVPTGGTSGQVLRKIDSNNYNTEWYGLSYASLLFNSFPSTAGSDITPVLGIGHGITVSGNTIILANPGVYQVKADLGIRCTFAEYAFVDASNTKWAGTSVGLCGSVNSGDPTSVSGPGGIIVTTAPNTLVKLRLINIGGFNATQFMTAAGAQIVQIR